MTASVRILTTQTVDSSPCIVLVSPNGSKIIVNCGEGTQRAFLEYQQRVSTIQAVCVTHLSHEAIGGLPGMILTAADVQATAELAQQQQFEDKTAKDGSDVKPKSNNLTGLDLFGPHHFKQFIRSLRHFVRREAFSMVIYEGLQQKVNLGGRKKSKNDREGFMVDTFAFDERLALHAGHKRPREQYSRQLISYLFYTSEYPGKFSVQKAKALGVPPGPLYGQLKLGKSITFSDRHGIDTIIESHQVVEPAIPGCAVLVIQYPSNRDDLSNFFDQFDLVQRCETYGLSLDLVIHLAPMSYYECPESVNWRKQVKFTKHILVDTKAENRDGTPFRSARIAAIARSLLDQSIYQVPSGPIFQKHSPTIGDGMLATPSMEYVLLPPSKKGFNACLPTDIDGDNRLAHDLVIESGALSAVQQLHAGNHTSMPGRKFGGEIIFTGTGSALPCKHRNVTGICVTNANGKSILLDIGEGTVGQLLRLHPDKSPDAVLAAVKAVWVSHPHADHHLGIIRLLVQRPRGDPLLLIAPPPLLEFLIEYSDIEPNIQSSYIPIECEAFVQNFSLYDAQLQNVLGISRCQAIPVAHCRFSYAIIMEGTSFGRLVYSGDCRPSKDLADAATGADLLIHEATFEDGLEAEAFLKRHSTVGEALGVASQMKAKCIVLTHFSQRYPKLSPVNEDRSHGMPIIYAFDWMSLTPSNLFTASQLTPTLRLLYPEEEEEDARNYSEDIEKNDSASSILQVPGVFARSDLL